MSIKEIKQPFDKKSKISVRALTLEDWENYRAFRDTFPDGPQHWGGYFQERDLDAPDTGENFFRDMQQSRNYRFKFFGLFDEDKLIGHTGITFLDHFNGEERQTALLGVSEISPAYQGNGLADHLYEHRMAFLKSIEFDGQIVMTIAPDNEASKKPAARNGFEKTGKQNGEGSDIWTPK